MPSRAEDSGRQDLFLIVPHGPFLKNVTDFFIIAAVKKKIELFPAPYGSLIIYQKSIHNKNNHQTPASVRIRLFDSCNEVREIVMGAQRAWQMNWAISLATPCQAVVAVAALPGDAAPVRA